MGWLTQWLTHPTYNIHITYITWPRDFPKTRKSCVFGKFHLNRPSPQVIDANWGSQPQQGWGREPQQWQWTIVEVVITMNCFKALMCPGELSVIKWCAGLSFCLCLCLTFRLMYPWGNAVRNISSNESHRSERDFVLLEFVARYYATSCS